MGLFQNRLKVQLTYPFSGWGEALKFRFMRLRLLLEKMGFSPWGNYYHCMECGLFFEKGSIPTSGYDAEDTMEHVHCPKCGKQIDS